MTWWTPSRAARLRRWFPVSEGQRPLETWAFGAAVAFVLWGLFHDFGSHPSGLFIDEVVNGYNAFCITQDLRDQHGTFLPLFFAAFGDHRSPLFLYPQALSVALLGLNDVAVRLPAALYAIAGAVAFAILVDRLTKRPVLARWLGVGWLTVPCLFTFARTGIAEASCFPFFLIVALLAALAFQEQPTTRNATKAGALLALCFYAYTTARLLAPLWVLCALAAFAKPPYRRKLGAFTAAAAAVGLPALWFQLTSPIGLGQRFSEISIFTDHPPLGIALLRFLDNYVAHLLGVDFLFHSGQPMQIYNPGEGFLPLWLFAPLVLGFYALWGRRGQPWIRLVIAMIATSPVAASLTWGSNLPHTARFLHFAPLALLAGALGLSDWLESARPPRAVLALAVGAMMFEEAMTFSLYFGDYRRTIDADGGWHQGEGAALETAFKERRPGELMYLPPTAFDYNCIFLAYYSRMSPTLYRATFDRRNELHPERLGMVPATSEEPMTGILVASFPLPDAPGLEHLSLPDHPRPKWSVSRVTDVSAKPRWVAPPPDEPARPAPAVP